MNNFVLGLELLVIGMGTVFISLYLLSVFLYFSGKILGPDKKEEKINKSNSNKFNLKEEKDTAVRGISPQKVAAVTAAISESLEPQKNFKIISIQKSSQNWKK